MVNWISRRAASGEWMFNRLSSADSQLSRVKWSSTLVDRVSVAQLDRAQAAS